MKRSVMLTPLSRDHHHALRVCQVLRHCDAADAGEVRQEFARFWGPHRHHLHIEEEVLFLAFARHREGDDPMIGRALEDHATLRRLAERVLAADTPPVESMHELAGRLNDHVRFEERSLFPAIEAAIPAPEQAALSIALEHCRT